MLAFATLREVNAAGCNCGRSIDCRLPPSICVLVLLASQGLLAAKPAVAETAATGQATQRIRQINVGTPAPRPPSQQRRVPTPRPRTAAAPQGPATAPAEPVSAPAPVRQDAASEQQVAGEKINAAPVARAGEVLEVTPGLIVTQHSGEGKANQYFLRGFNLDHGTDLAITLDGMPINMRTHGHGQGYADVNFLIPELVQSMRVRKGPYFAEEGDFASAGALRIDYINTMNPGLWQGTLGMYGYGRALAIKSYPISAGTPWTGNSTVTNPVAGNLLIAAEA